MGHRRHACVWADNDFASPEPSVDVRVGDARQILSVILVPMGANPEATALAALPDSHLACCSDCWQPLLAIRAILRGPTARSVLFARLCSLVCCLPKALPFPFLCRRGSQSRIPAGECPGKPIIVGIPFARDSGDLGFFLSMGPGRRSPRFNGEGLCLPGRA